MDITKTVKYDFSMSPAEVTSLYAELRQLFTVKPELVKVFPNSAVFARGLANRLGRHDFSQEVVDAAVKGMIERGLNAALGLPEAEIKPEGEATPANTEEGNQAAEG